MAAQHNNRADLIRNVPMLRKAAETPEFLQLLTRALTSKVMPPSASVYKRGERGQCMYFVVSGEVAVVGDDGEEKVLLGPGSHFGEVGLLMNTMRIVTVRTMSTVMLLVLRVVVCCPNLCPNRKK